MELVAAVPVLVSVQVKTAVLGAVTGELLLHALSASEGIPVPVPVRLTVLAPGPVLKDKLPVRVPTPVGVNRRVTVQFALAGKLDGHVVETKLKSVPVTDAALGTETEMALGQWFVNTDVPVADCPSCTLGKLGVLRSTVGATPCVALAKGAEPGMVATLSMLLGTVLWTTVRCSLQRNQLSPAVLSAK